METMEQDGQTGESSVSPVSRKIILASAIADSSVTIPNVSVVIDLCRALEVSWNYEKKRHIPKTVWASHSICDQRKGRTGRTCSGKVFRLVQQSFYLTHFSAPRGFGKLHSNY